MLFAVELSGLFAGGGLALFVTAVAAMALADY